MVNVSERSFEEAIECGLLQDGPDACAGDTTVVRETPLPYGDTLPGGYRKRSPANYDRALCLIPRDVVDFILATQPKEWEKLKQHHGAAVTEQFLKRLAHGRCLAHFAVDPDLVYVTTHLAGPNTRFLPFNQGKFGGAGNPPVPPTRNGYATAYLWLL